MTRRDFFNKAGAAGMTGWVVQETHADQSEGLEQDKILNPVLKQPSPNQALPPGEPGRDYTPVITPNGTSLPYKVIDEVKIFNLIAEEVEHEFAPGLRAQCWGFNGRVHGPTLEAVEGDKLRIYVTNNLPESPSIHWHGVLVPNGMDGVGGLNQKPIEPGEIYKYEFELRQHGPYMYHWHAAK